MFHLDYVGLFRGPVFANRDREFGFIALRGECNLAEFFKYFVYAAGREDPFTISMTEMRYRRINRRLKKSGYHGILLQPEDYTRTGVKVSTYGYWHHSKTNPFLKE